MAWAWGDHKRSHTRRGSDHRVGRVATPCRYGHSWHNSTSSRLSSCNPSDKPIPPAVWAALAVMFSTSLAYLFVAQPASEFGLAGFIGFTVTYLFIAVCGVLIFSGVLRGHALAHLYIKRVALVLCAPILVLSLACFGMPTDAATVISMLSMVTVIVAYVLLRGKQSRQFYALDCPKCDSSKVKAKDFLFKKRECKACKHSWEGGYGTSSN